MTKLLKALIVGYMLLSGYLLRGQEIYPGADESTPSRAQYFSWINNTNEGATEYQTMVNLEFFAWLRREYGMQLDIYAFDAGAIDGKRFYGSTGSARFRRQFPNGFDPVYKRAGELGIRLGVWGGPDGFGETREEAEARIEQMVSLCRDYEFALFKFDAVCGPLRPEKEDYFIDMMTRARSYSPDLILLNHRLGLERAKPYATTFLWGGAETYIDVFMNNRVTAPHHRAEAISRGLVPGLERLTEDHGVCISSCIDYWEDDLVLQAFNRNLILSPQIYGNPWLMRDDEFPRLARIYNIHRRYREIMVTGDVLPESYGPYAVSRGDNDTRIITLRNLSWEEKSYRVVIGPETGLRAFPVYHARLFHPVERILGTYRQGESVEFTVPPFRSFMMIISTGEFSEPGIIGTDYLLVKDNGGDELVYHLLGEPGTSTYIQLDRPSLFGSAYIGGEQENRLVRGRVIEVTFPGRPLSEPLHRKLGSLSPSEIPADAETLYEATVFAADNNALEVRSLLRSGPTGIKEVQDARDAFFNQETFRKRGIWDRNLFDGDPETSFFPSRKYRRDMRIRGGCFRLDLGEVMMPDSIILITPDEYSLQPLLAGEGNYAELSADLSDWRTLTYLAGERMVIIPDGPVRYLRFRDYADRLSEIEVYIDGKPADNTLFRASNLFAHPEAMKPVRAWSGIVKPTEIAPGSYISVAINGNHGEEGAYAAIRIDGNYHGAPDRARSYPSNTWEYINAPASSNYTYYFPADTAWAGKEIELFVIGYSDSTEELNPEVWISPGPSPESRVELRLIKKEEK